MRLRTHRILVGVPIEYRSQAAAIAARRTYEVSERTLHQAVHNQFYVAAKVMDTVADTARLWLGKYGWTEKFPPTEILTSQVMDGLSDDWWEESTTIILSALPHYEQPVYDTLLDVVAQTWIRLDVLHETWLNLELTAATLKDTVTASWLVGEAITQWLPEISPLERQKLAVKVADSIAATTKAVCMAATPETVSALLLAVRKCVQMDISCL